MGEQMVYMETGSHDPRYNLAFEEYILRSRQNGRYLILWQNDNTVVVGRNQNAKMEINPVAVKKYGVNIVRRITGGGAVYHDLGNLNYSFIADAEDADQMMLERFTLPVVRALQGLGLQAESSGRNDILVEGHKVSGTAQRIYRNRILHHGTLLFDSDLERMAEVLHVNQEKFAFKAAKSVRSRVTNIRSCLNDAMEMQEFWQYLKETIAEGVLNRESLSAADLEAVGKLKREKYDTWEWTFGLSSQYGMKNSRKWPGGTLEVRLSSEKGRITEIGFYGDFMACCELSEITQALCGCPIQRDAIKNILERYPLERYFGTITKDQIIETITAP